MNSRMLQSALKAKLANFQPIIITNPGSRRKGLYAASVNTMWIEGMDRAESEAHLQAASDEFRTAESEYHSWVARAEALAEGRPLRAPRWGLPDVLIAILIALIVPTLVLGAVVLVSGGCTLIGPLVRTGYSPLASADTGDWHAQIA